MSSKKGPGRDRRLRPPQHSKGQRDTEGRPPGDDSGDMLHFTPPPPDWVPPDEAGQAILRVVIAVKKRRDATGKDAT